MEMFLYAFYVFTQNTKVCFNSSLLSFIIVLCLVHTTQIRVKTNIDFFEILFGTVSLFQCVLHNYLLTDLLS